MVKVAINLTSPIRCLRYNATGGADFIVEANPDSGCVSLLSVARCEGGTMAELARLVFAQRMTIEWSDTSLPGSHPGNAALLVFPVSVSACPSWVAGGGSMRVWCSPPR